MRIMIQGHMNLAQAYCGMWNDLGNMENQHTTQNKDNKTWASKKRIRMGMFLYSYLVVVQSLSRVWLFVTPWTAAHQASLSFIISQSLLRFRSIESVVQPSHPLLSPSPPAFNLCQHLVNWFFTSGSQSIGALASASVLLMNIQDWFPLGITGLISLHSQGLSRVFNTTA